MASTSSEPTECLSFNGTLPHLKAALDHTYQLVTDMPPDGISGGYLMKESIHVLKEFLEVAFHYILYVRQVYPSDLFEKKKKYDVPVWKSRHPTLNAYIGQVIRSAGDEISRGTVSRLVLSIKDHGTGQELENFVFDLQYLIDLEIFKSERDKDKRPPKESGGLPQYAIELQMRALLLKLSTMEGQLVDLPPDLTFTTFLELNDDGHGEGAASEQPGKPLSKGKDVRTHTASQKPRSAGLIVPLSVPLPPRHPIPSSPDSSSPQAPQSNWVPAPLDTSRKHPGGRRRTGEELEGEGVSDERAVSNTMIVPVKGTNVGMMHVQMLVQEFPAKTSHLEKKIARQRIRLEEEEAEKRRKEKGKGKLV